MSEPNIAVEEGAVDTSMESSVNVNLNGNVVLLLCSVEHFFSSSYFSIKYFAILLNMYSAVPSTSRPMLTDLSHYSLDNSDECTVLLTFRWMTLYILSGLTFVLFVDTHELWQDNKCVVCQTKHFSLASWTSHIRMEQHQHKVLIYEFLTDFSACNFDHVHNRVPATGAFRIMSCLYEICAQPRSYVRAVNRVLAAIVCTSFTT
jgi:hypothetical protein